MSRCKICNDKPGKEKIKCDICEQLIHKKNMKRHKENKHNNNLFL